MWDRYLYFETSYKQSMHLQSSVIPTDFIILEMPEDEKISIILGRPFLSTTGASVDCAEGEIIFNVYDAEIIRYFPKKLEVGERYDPPAKRVHVVSAFDKGKPKVRIREHKKG